MNRRLTLFLTSLTLAACISAPPQSTLRTPDNTATAREDESATTGNSASILLLRQGQAERNAGLYQDATSSIERALRIDPNNAYLWIELGEIKNEEGDREQADMMARKALTLAAGDRSIEARANELMGR